MRANSTFLMLLLLAATSPNAFGQVRIRFPSVESDSSALLATTAILPTQEQVVEPTFERIPPTDNLSTWISPRDGGISKSKLAELMRPTFGLVGEWQAPTNDIDLASFDARIQLPTYPFFGPPPPFINGGFSYTTLNAPQAFDLPTDVYDYSLGFAWMRPINDRWIVRFMFSVALATDGKNTTSDAWQYRGGVFAMYRPRQEVTWTFGAIALGRNDLPVVPAVGVIWQPKPGLRFDLIMPKPKVAFLLVDNGPRQQWGYIGAGLNGGTWAYERAGGINDQLTYGDWRVVLGWESTPTPEPGMPFTRGRKLGVEIGYVFSREFEFDSGLPSIPLDDTWMIRGSLSF